MGQGAYLTHAVVHEPYIDTFFCFADQYIQQTARHVSFINDEILHENEFFCLLQLLKHRLEHLLPDGIICHVIIFIYRKASAVVDVAVDHWYLRVFALDLVDHGPVLRQFVHCFAH